MKRKERQTPSKKSNKIQGKVQKEKNAIFDIDKEGILPVKDNRKTRTP